MTTEHVSATVLFTVGSRTAEEFVHIGAAQKSVLQTIFAENPYPSKATLCQLATHLGLAVIKVHSWFQNERQRVATYKNQTLSNGENYAYVVILILLIGSNLLK